MEGELKAGHSWLETVYKNVYTYLFRPLAFHAPFVGSFCQQLAINSNNSEFNINYQSA